MPWVCAPTERRKKAVVGARYSSESAALNRLPSQSIKAADNAWVVGGGVHRGAGDQRPDLAILAGLRQHTFGCGAFSGLSEAVAPRCLSRCTMLAQGSGRVVMPSIMPAAARTSMSERSWESPGSAHGDAVAGAADSPKTVQRAAATCAE